MRSVQVQSAHQIHVVLMKFRVRKKGRKGTFDKLDTLFGRIYLVRLFFVKRYEAVKDMPLILLAVLSFRPPALAVSYPYR